MTTNSSTSVANTSMARCQRGPDVGPHQVDGDVAAAVAGGGDAPEDQDAEQQAAEVVGVGDRHREQVAQQHGDEDVGGDDADEERGHPLDGVDEAVHARCVSTLARAVSCGSDASLCRSDGGEWARRRHPRIGDLKACQARSIGRIVLGERGRELLQTASGSPPTLRTLSAQAFTTGSRRLASIRPAAASEIV